MTTMVVHACTLDTSHLAFDHVILKSFLADTEGFWVFAQPGGLNGEKAALGGIGGFSKFIGDFGASLILFHVFWKSQQIKWCFVHLLRGEVLLPSVLCPEFPHGLIISGNRFRRVRDVDMKHDFAFVEFSDPRDADDARYNLDGRDLSGSRIIVEFAKGGSRGRGSSHEYLGRGPPPGSGRCFNCGLDGHWARDCKAGDWKNKCYRCGERGHIERNCTNSPKNLRRGRSHSRSPSPRRGRYSRSRSPRRGGRRGSPPYRRRERSLSPDERPRRRELSLTPDGSRSPLVDRDMSPSPKGAAGSEHDGSDYDRSPRRRENSRSPRSQDEQGSPAARGNSSSPKANGRSPSPVKDDDGYASRGGSQSP